MTPLGVRSPRLGLRKQAVNLRYHGCMEAFPRIESRLETMDDRARLVGLLLVKGDRLT
ncbi:hypothetical protein GCM10029978_067310 [Actinoallomurus acanthiterrae]